MAAKAYFVIADITGYTAFLTGSELEHAQDILKTLFNTLHDHIKPPLIISNYQGDAILTYAPEGSFVQGQTLLETIENIYCEFASTLENMHRNTTCTCNACANIPRLDLKLFVHYGEYVIQDMRGKSELSGPDVIIAHRMMKNDVKEKTNLRAYTLFTERAINQLNLGDFTCEMKSHSESYDHIGEVKMYAYCLRTMWEREREKRRVFIDRDEAWLVVDVTVPVPPPVAWDYLNEPEKMRQIVEANRVFLSGINRGRMDVGTVHHCAHGQNAQTDFVIVDWKPFEYKTEDIRGLPMGITGQVTTRLTPTEDGTIISFIVNAPGGNNAMGRTAARLMRPMIRRELDKSYHRNGEIMLEMISADVSSGALVPAPNAAAMTPA